MPTLSVIIITKNEQTHIRDCIESVSRVADEIIVLDSLSTDQTAQIADSLGAKVSISDDWQGFGIQKNRALALAKSDWILSIDADERVTPELANEIESLLKSEPRGTCFYLSRKSWYCGRLIKHSGWQDDKILRLFKRGCAEFTNDRVHERIIRIEQTGAADMPTQALPFAPEPSTLKGELMHFSFTNFEQVLVKINRYSSLWAEQEAAKGRTASPLTALTHGLSAFLKTYLFQAGFLDGWHGLALAISNAQGTYYKYLKLWHLNQQTKSNV